MAVGYYENADTQLALTEVWNGRNWSTISGVDPSATENYLQGVSCVSSSDCTAVGYYADDVTGNYSTLVEHWNGASWSQATSVNPSTSHNYLQGVWCVSGSDCTAVGYYVDAVDFTTTYSLIEHWNGTSWSQVASIDPSTVSNVLSGVSCVSSSDCTAAGHYSTTGSYVRSLIEHWNGASWTQKTGGDRANYDNNINAVSCPTSDYCAAVGYYPNYNPDISQDQTLIQSWNGTSWTLTDSPNVAPASGAYANQLKGVSRSSSNTCTAVGLYGSTSHHTLVEYWDGSSWQIVASPDATSA